MPSAHETDTGHGYVAASSVLGDFRFGYEVEVTGVAAGGRAMGGCCMAILTCMRLGGGRRGGGWRECGRGEGRGRGWGRGRGRGDGVRF